MQYSLLCLAESRASLVGMHLVAADWMWSLRTQFSVAVRHGHDAVLAVMVLLDVGWSWSRAVPQSLCIIRPGHFMENSARIICHSLIHRSAFRGCIWAGIGSGMVYLAYVLLSPATKFADWMDFLHATVGVREFNRESDPLPSDDAVDVPLTELLDENCTFIRKYPELFLSVIGIGASGSPPCGFLGLFLVDPLVHLYIKGKKNSRMMLESIENLPLVYLTIEENGQICKKKYAELIEQEKIQDDCDVQATNIVLQGLPLDVYSLVNHCRAAKDIWDRTQLNHTPPSVPQNGYHTPSISQQPQVEFPQLDSRLAVPSFLPSDDPIACLNKAMEFMSTVMASRFPSKNNQLRTSSNLRIQATIQDGRVTVQQGEGHMARQCTKPKRPRNSAWFKEKMLLVQAYEFGQTKIPQNAMFQTDDLDAYDSDCDDISSAKAVLMANLSSCDSDVPSEYLQETQNAIVQDTNSSAQQDSMIISMFEHMSKQMSNHVTNWDKVNQETKTVNESLTAELERYKERVKTFEQRLNIDLSSHEKFIDSQIDDMIQNRNALKQEIDSLKQTLSNHVKEKESDLFNDFDNGLNLELNEVKMVINQMKAVVKQCSVDKNMLILYMSANHKCLVDDNLKSERLIQENDHLFELLLSQDIVHICVNYLATLTNYAKMEQDYIDEYNENLVLKAELVNKKENMVEKKVFNEVVLRCSRLVNRYANLELKLQHQKESFQNNIPLNNKDALELSEIFKINEWKAKLNAKDVSIANLRKHIESLKGNNVVENDATPNNAKVIAPGMFKLDLDPLSPKVDSYKTQDSNKPVLPSTGMKSSTSVSRSHPSGNTKNNKISQTTSSNQKNKVEDHPRSVKSSSNKTNRVIEPVCNANVKHSMLIVNSELICATCNECMFDAIYDLCILDFVNDVNVRSKSKSSKRSKKKTTWKPTSKFFTNVGYKWIPTGRKFTIDGNRLSKLFGNDQISKIMGYGDYQMGNIMISWVCYVEGLGHNLFFVGQFCDSGLKVAFCKHTCYIFDLKGIDLLKGSRGSNLYTLSLEDMMLSSPICLLSKASKTKSWLWHQRLSYLNFDYITTLAKQGLVRGLPRLKFQKDHLCSTCELEKSKKHSYKPKAEDSIQDKLYLLHMDLCEPMRIQSINGWKYILVIIDDYSRFTWVKFLRSKDEVSEFVIKFLKMIQVHLNVIVRNIRTDNGTEFVNQTMRAYYEDNQTLVEAARTTLIFSKASLFLWAEAVAIPCYTQKRSLIRKRHNKTPYELLHNRKPNLSYLHVFGALCYPTNDSEDLGKLKPKADIGIFVGYALTKKAY
ncbi:retrovirus-related pol polyprotein from transposon TNT 1-94 [Tanacetum coccineum]